jgi:AcrR family transcriptional regulator
VSASKESGRKPDAVRTRADILAVARAEFVEHGLSGARVDAIAERTRTTKRMIYYYFGSEEGLYSAVLEQAYSDIRSTEATLALEDQDPLATLRTLIEFTFDYEDSLPDFVRLISIENIRQAGYLKQLPTI